MKFFIWLLGGIFSICLLAGCSKQAPIDVSAPKDVALGVVEFTAGQPSRHDVGDGKVCIITVTALDASTLELIAVLEKAGKQVASARVSPAASDRPVDLSLADVQLHLTPHMK